MTIYEQAEGVLRRKKVAGHRLCLWSNGGYLSTRSSDRDFIESYREHCKHVGRRHDVECASTLQAISEDGEWYGPVTDQWTD